MFNMNNKFFNIFLFLTFLFEQNFGTLAVSDNNKKPFNSIFKNNSKKKVEFLFNKKTKNNNSDNSGNDSESTTDCESDFLGKGYGLSSGGGQRKAIEDNNGNFFDENGNKIILDLNKSYAFTEFNSRNNLKSKNNSKVLELSSGGGQRIAIEEFKILENEIKKLKKELGIKNKFHNNSDNNNNDISDNKTLIGGFSKKEIKEKLLVDFFMKISYDYSNKKKEMQNNKLFNQEYYQKLEKDKISKYREKERKRNKEDKITIITEEQYKELLEKNNNFKNNNNNNNAKKDNNNAKKASFSKDVGVRNFELFSHERKLDSVNFQVIKNIKNEFRHKIELKDNNSFYYEVTISNNKNKIFFIKKIYYKDGRNSEVNDEVVWIGQENYSKEKFLSKKFINQDAIISFILKKENENNLERKWEEILKKNKNNFRKRINFDRKKIKK